TLLRALPAMAGTIRSLRFDRDRLAATAAGGFALATDLAEELVRRGVPFRTAHERVGRVVAACEERGSDLDGLGASVLAGLLPELEGADVAALLSPARAVERRAAVSGPAPVRVRAQVA